MNLFERASRQKIRFSSARGDLTTEQLWDMPLTARNQFDLDTVAKTVNQELKQITEDSFVATTANPAKSALELKLDVVKHIINARIEQTNAAQKRAANAAERQRLTEILHQKKDQERMNMSPEDIQKQIDRLSE